MRRVVTPLCLATLLAFPGFAAAGGSEFPAGGARGIGRGGSNFARADDPMLMLRNPALLADLWTDMAMSGAYLLLADSCFHATGDFGIAAEGFDVADFGDGPVLVNPPRGATDLQGQPLLRLQDEPLPQVCYQGTRPIFPHVALTMKLSPSLGVGLGFFPPDNAALAQWGDRDGTVETAQGRRPSPTRFFRSHLNVSYFSALAAVGYRLADWLRVGLGFQWALVVYSTTMFSRTSTSLSLNNDNRTNVFGRDLFIPGLIASLHITPIAALDVAFGFKWADRVESAAKLDITTGAFGSGEVFEYKDAMGAVQRVGSSIPYTTHNRAGQLSAPPIWVPQLSFGVRFADRLTPRVSERARRAAHLASGPQVQDSMATERWDIEADAVVYFNSATDLRTFKTPGGFVDLRAIDATGNQAMSQVRFGACPRPAGDQCLVDYEIPARLHGKDQISLRLGGDYNILPGVFAIRGGLSYESNGQNPANLDVTNYMLGRAGLHLGATLRIADQTDVSLGFVHFIQKTVRLLFNSAMNAPLPSDWVMDPAKYHVIQGRNDGVAAFSIADAADPNEGPNYVNAGAFYYNLSVVSVSLAQHF